MKNLTLVQLESCDSTNTEAWKLLEQGWASSVVVVCERQTHGRGRQGRAWEAARPGNIAMSVALRPAPQNLQWVPLAAGVAAIRAVAEGLKMLFPGIVLSELRLKWPNDLMWGKAKLGGVLCESRFAGSIPSAVVAGIGLNVEWAPELPELTTTSIFGITGHKSESVPELGMMFRSFFIHRCAEELMTWAEKLSTEPAGTRELRDAWSEQAKLDRFPLLTVHDKSGKLVNIRADSLGEDGHLRARLESDPSRVVSLDQADSL